MTSPTSGEKGRGGRSSRPRRVSGDERARLARGGLLPLLYRLFYRFLLFPLILPTRWRSPSPRWLGVELAGDIPPQPLRSWWGGRGEFSQPEWEDLFRRAAGDSSVKGVELRLGHLSLGWARLMELRAALQEVSQAGKEVRVQLLGGGIKEYVLATAGTRLLLAPQGTLDLVGLRAELHFLGDALRRFGVEPEFISAGKYKSFGEMFTRNAPSEAAQQALESLLTDLGGQLAAAVSSGRGWSEEQGWERLVGGPYLGEEALQRGMVDRLGYPDQLRWRRASVSGEEKVEMVSGKAWYQRHARRQRWKARSLSRPVIGVMTAQGSIHDQDGGEGSINPRSFSRVLMALARDPRVGAIVIRVDSPGGSAAASDLLWRAVRRASRWKPVVASFGDVAASGGYYLAAGADRVISGAASITGSVGVVAGRFDLAGLFQKVGVSRTVVGRSDRGGIYSQVGPLSPAERAWLESMVTRSYRAFLAKVARGRHLTISQVEMAAEGRVWTGRQAKELGLVDGLGGVGEAVVLAASLAELPDYSVMHMSATSPFPWERWRRRLPFATISEGDWLKEMERAVGSEGLLARMPFHVHIR